MTSISAVSYLFISIMLFFRDFDIFQKSQKHHTIACGPRSCTIACRFSSISLDDNEHGTASGTWTRARKLRGTTFIQRATVAAWWTHKMPNRKWQEHQRLASFLFFLIFREMSKTQGYSLTVLHSMLFFIILRIFEDFQKMTKPGKNASL